MSVNQSVFTILYLENNSVAVKHQICKLETAKSGRVIIPTAIKEGKSILAVCHGAVNVINKHGDRLEPLFNLPHYVNSEHKQRIRS